MTEKGKVHLLPGDFVFREGEFGQTAFMIDSGEVEIIKFTGDKNTVLAELSKGALFGEMAIIESSPRSASARAKTECVLTEITEDRLKKYLSSSPNVALDMMRRLAGFARSANERLTRDAFEELPSSTVETEKRSQTKNANDLDIETKKTLQEFNDDIDNFSDISPNKPLAISGLVIIILVIAFGFWASFTEIDVTVSARGKILTSIPNVEVQSNYSSVLKEILVEKGEVVKKGQPIAIFDETLTASDYRKTEEEIVALRNDILRTQAELNFMLDKSFQMPTEQLQKAIFESNLDEITMQKQEHESNVDSLEIKLLRIDAEIKNLNDEIRLFINPEIKENTEKLLIKEAFLTFIQKIETSSQISSINNKADITKIDPASVDFSVETDAALLALVEKETNEALVYRNLQSIEAILKRLAAKAQILNFLQNKPVVKPKNSEYSAYYEFLFAELSRSIEDLEAQVNFAENDLARSEKLFNTQTIPRSDFDKKIHEAESAELELKKFFTSKLASLTDEVINLEGELSSLLKELEQNKIKTVGEIESLNKKINDLKKAKRSNISDTKSKKIDKKEVELELAQAHLASQKFTSEKLKQKNTELKSFREKHLGLSEKFLKLSRQMEDVKLYSPVEGTILKLEDNFEGSVINTGDIIATVVPTDVNFHVEVDIDPSDITHVYEGADVKIMLDALPSQKHGELRGVITMLSKDTVDENVFGEANSVYRANIEILENNLVKLPDGFQLLPSMSVAGNIVSGKRSVMTYLLFPIIKTLETSFREP